MPAVPEENIGTRDPYNNVAIWWTDPSWTFRDVAVNYEGAMFSVSWTGWNGVSSDINNDAWWKPKTSLDLSLFHWLWTYNVPQALWHIEENWTELVNNDTSTLCISDKGQLEITAWASIWNVTRLRSRRHPRYQPNRWHKFGTAWYMPSPSATGIRKWWFRSNWDWVHFQLEDWVLTWEMINTDWPNKSVTLDLSKAWITDVSALANWHLYDIQYQWRGVWNYYFYIDLKLVGVITNLWTWTQVTISNPAMSVNYECENTDWTQVEMAFGCVDVTSEWGKREWNTYLSATQDLTDNEQWRGISWRDQPLIILRVKETLYSKSNTRDVILNRISASSDNKSVMKLYYARGDASLWGSLYPWALWEDVQMWSWVEMIDCTDLSDTEITFNPALANKVYAARVPQDWSSEIGNPSEDIEFFIEAWDYLILTGEREQAWGCNMFWNVEMGEEI